MNLRKFRPEVGQVVRVLTNDNDAISGTLMRASRTEIELKPGGLPAARITVHRDNVRDVETRYADLSAFIPHPGRDQPGVLTAVTPEEAVSNTIAVYACVSLIAGTIGSLECALYREQEGTVRQKIEGDTALASMPGPGYPGTLARVIGQVPNREQSAVEFWETVVGHIELQGEAFVNVVRGSDGRPKELWPLRPDRMEVFRHPGGEKFYVYQIRSSSGPYGGTSKRVLFNREEIMHIPGLSFDGLRGISPIEVARRAISGEQAANRYAEKFYQNSATPSGIVTIPRGPQDRFNDRARVYREALEGLYSGVANAGRLAVVEEGVDWKVIGMSMADQQFIEQRKWSTVEIARLFGVPPHMIGETERSTSWGTGIEQQSLGFLTYTLRPIMEHIEAAMNRDLGLVPSERTLEDEHLCPEFDASEILRTDITARYQAYATGIQWGYLTRADARAAENLEPIEGLEKPIYPSNMAVLGEPLPDAGTQLGQAMAAFMSREQVPPRVTVNNHPPAEGSGHLAEAVEGMRNELRAVELFGRVKDDLEAIHVLKDEAIEARTETLRAVEAVADQVKTSEMETRELLSDAMSTTSDRQMVLFEGLQDLKKPTKLVPRRGKDGLIESMDRVDPDGKVISRIAVSRNGSKDISEVVEVP